MGRFKELLIETNYIKKCAEESAKKMTIDISRFGKEMVNSWVMREAAIKRYRLDQILLDESSLVNKWGQGEIYDLVFGRVLFRGTIKECYKYMDENDILSSFMVSYVLPDDIEFDWNMYLRKISDRCNIRFDEVFR